MEKDIVVVLVNIGIILLLSFMIVLLNPGTFLSAIKVNRSFKYYVFASVAIPATVACFHFGVGLMASILFSFAIQLYAYRISKAA